MHYYLVTEKKSLMLLVCIHYFPHKVKLLYCLHSLYTEECKRIINGITLKAYSIWSEVILFYFIHYSLSLLH